MNSPQVRLFGIDDAAHANQPERAQLRVYALANQAVPGALLAASSRSPVAGGLGPRVPVSCGLVGLFFAGTNAVLHDRVILQNPIKPFAISLLIAIAPLLAGAGGKYSNPYALFEAEQRRPAADTRPAFIMRIDEKYVKIGTNDPIAPGNHEVELSIPGTPGSSQSTRVKMTIEAKPCTRYYFAAQRSTRSARDWEAFVAGSESIRECVKRFPDAK